MFTLDWVCDEIGAKNYIVCSRRHDKKTVSQRRVIITFFRLLGKSSTWCGRVLSRDHSSILVAERNVTPEEKIKAAILVNKHQSLFGGKMLDDAIYALIRPKIKIKVPNYKIGGIDFKEVYADEYNPNSGKLPPYRNKKSGRWEI